MKVTDYNSPVARIVEDFIDKETCDWIIEYANRTNSWSHGNAKREDFIEEEHFLRQSAQWDNRRIDLTGFAFQGKEKELVDVTHKINVKAREQVKDFFNIGNQDTLLECWEVVRWYHPFQQKPHIDYIDPDFDRTKVAPDVDLTYFTESDESLWKSKFTTKHYTSMLYLNDDFEGGELYFPTHNNFTIKPKPGMLAIFSGNIYNPHGVTQITSGTRYVNTAFWTRSQDFQKLDFSLYKAIGN